MRKLVLSTIAAAGIASLGVSAALADHHEAAPMVDTSGITSGTYSADASHSMVAWHVLHLGFNDYIGIFGDVAGTLVLDKENIAASTVDVTIPIASVTVPSEGLKDHLLRAGSEGRAPDFFGPTPEPARFVSTSVTSTGATTADITGNLTLNGVTKPVTIHATLSGSGTHPMNRKATVGFHGRATIKRSEWNMGWGVQFGLGDDMPVFISVAFEK